MSRRVTERFTSQVAQWMQAAHAAERAGQAEAVHAEIAVATTDADWQVSDKENLMLDAMRESTGRLRKAAP